MTPALTPALTPTPADGPQPAALPLALFAVGDRVIVTQGWNRGVSGTITAIYEYPGGYGYEFDTPRNVHLSAPETHLKRAP